MVLASRMAVSGSITNMRLPFALRRIIQMTDLDAVTVTCYSQFTGYIIAGVA